MATTYTTGASRMVAGVQPRILPEGFDTVEISTFNLANNAPVNASGFALNDVIYFMTLSSDTAIIGNGPTISGVALDLPALDTSTGIVTSVGDIATPGRYISGNTAGRSGAGGIAYANVAGTIGYQPFAALFNTYTTISYQTYQIVMKVTTAATGTASLTGVIALKVSYTVDP